MFILSKPKTLLIESWQWLEPKNAGHTSCTWTRRTICTRSISPPSWWLTDLCHKRPWPLCATWRRQISSFALWPTALQSTVFHLSLPKPYACVSTHSIDDVIYLRKYTLMTSKTYVWYTRHWLRLVSYILGLTCVLFERFLIGIERSFLKLYADTSVAWVDYLLNPTFW